MKAIYRKWYASGLGAFGAGLLVVSSWGHPAGFFREAVEAASAHVLVVGPTWNAGLVFGLFLVLGAATALWAGRIENDFLSLDLAVGLSALYLFGPLHAVWVLLGAALAREAIVRQPFWKRAERLAFAVGERTLMAVAAGMAYAAGSGRLPLDALGFAPAWGEVSQAGWAPMVVAGGVFFGVREVIRLPLRTAEEGGPQGLWSSPGMWLSQAGGEVSLAALTALVFSRLGFLPFLLLGALVVLTCHLLHEFVRSRDALYRRSEELRSLTLVGEAISSSMTVDDLFMLVYRECRKLLDTSLFCVAVYDPAKRVFRMELLAEGDEVLEGIDVPLGEGFESVVFHTRRPLVFQNRAEMEAHPQKRWTEVGRVECESSMWVPMVTQDGVLGVLCARHEKKDRYDEQSLRALSALAHQASVALENIRLFRKATTDNLSGLFMRAYFDKKLEEQLFKARRYGYRVSMMLLDLDDFKQINDTLGHAAGDVVLQEVGQTIGHSIRSQDVAARYGGDEFAVLLPGIPVEGCLEVAARIKGRIQALNFPVLARMGTSRITVSIGIATVAPDNGTDLASLYETADRALLEAKRTGKNRVLAREEKLA